MVRVEAVLDSWKAVRQDTALAVEEFPVGDFDFKPVPEVMSFRELAQHILLAGQALTGAMLKGMENLATPEFRAYFQECKAELPPHGSPAELSAALRSVLDARCAELQAQPAEYYERIITRMDGQRVTRLEMLQMVKEHELTHRSQMFLYLRLKGLVPAPTRRRQSQAKA